MKKSVTLKERIHFQLGNKLVSTNEIILAAIAWKNFLSQGIGYLHLEINSNIGDIGDFIVQTGEYKYSPNAIDVDYVAKGTEDFNNELERDSNRKCDERKYDDYFGEDFYNMDLSELVDDYDPEKHFIVLVRLPGYVKTSVGYYWSVTPEILPPKAFYMVKENPSVFDIIEFDPQ